jgi:lipopolysaccharide biosynthesis glycosyltransferase
MITPESLYQKYLTTKDTKEKRQYLEDAIKLGTDVVQIHCSYFMVLNSEEKEHYLAEFPCNDASSALFYITILQAICSVDVALLHAKLNENKLLDVCKLLNSDIPEQRVAILFAYSLYINTSEDVNLSTILNLPLSSVDIDYLQIIYFCTKGRFIEAADVLINNTNQAIPIAPSVLLDIISQTLFVDRNRAMGIISIANNIKNKLSAKEQDDLSEYILLAKDEAIKNESFIPKQGGIPIISNILVEAIAIKNQDVGLKILTGLFEIAIESKSPSHLETFLQGTRNFINTSNTESHHALYKMLEILDTVFQQNIDIKVLMIELSPNEETIVSVLKNVTSDEQSEQLQCLTFLCKNDLFGAIDYFYELSTVEPLPDILKYIISYDTVWGEEEIAVLDAVMQDIVSSNQEYDYYEAINIYLRILLDEYSCDEAIARISMFKKGIPSPYMIANAYYRKKDYESTYKELMSNLDAIGRVQPLGVWLLKSAQEINKTEELINTLEGNKNLVIQQIVASAKESLGLVSERSYKYSGDIETDRLDIIFCINKTYLEGFKVAFTSLIVNNENILNNLYFHIGFDNSVDEKEICTFLDSYNIKYYTKNLEVDYQTKDLKYDYGFTTDHYLDKSAYYRIFMIDYILENLPEVSRILYLDSDVLVLSSIIELTKIKMNNPLMAYLEDQGSKAVAQSKKQNLVDEYFNSGVLLVDCYNKLTKKCIKYSIKQSYENVDNLIMHDQCALNIGFNKKFDKLPVKYNFLIHQNEFGLRKPSVSILHLSGRTKPWQNHYHNEEFISNLWHTYKRIMQTWTRK